jgi:hypothetical protein
VAVDEAQQRTHLVDGALADRRRQVPAIGPVVHPGVADARISQSIETSSVSHKRMAWCSVMGPPRFQRLMAASLTDSAHASAVALKLPRICMAATSRSPNWPAAGPAGREGRRPSFEDDGV